MTLRDEAKEAIIGCFRRKHGKPVYVGEASCVIGWPLSDTQGLFAELQVEGLIRRANADERARYDIRLSDAVYVLIRA